ncbi:Txe/YoeB family addiction module toxin [Phytohabitans houttuyneae]|uniref:Endoribonuclease YoeB n=1 Tax=Phytohabitans houttuyneae TaxID=1076126 RepID=A0A6V8KI95_9ACTN|nr:Txe/YoeB family addiction module toxin [Phytohabitans houttuyneae]GFJ84922.1 toxin YoeB [Phytohabitans houttuyneae]
MSYIWSDDAWSDYVDWQKLDAAKVAKINDLLKDIRRNPHSGIGKPEPLKHSLKGYWSRRIDREHRLVYKVADGDIHIASCRFHYKD